MVFYYTIRGGRCLNEHSHIELKSEDITCYVGRDKHENEYLIQYGWPGDIWFHVDALSSAHVYFRLKNSEEVSSIPIDNLPTDSVYDMMQICKNNSIAGCKLASCKMVYTPHSNLKKTSDMESGAVSYHNTKLCRYQRCDKDRQRVKELEKTKTVDLKVDYYQEMKDNERRIIERKKRMRKDYYQTGMGNDELQVYDPVTEDIKASKLKANRQGDKESGLDVALAALEGLSFISTPAFAAGDHDPSNPMHVEKLWQSPKTDEPLWVQEQESRDLQPSADVRFLCERGYAPDDAIAALRATKSRVVALSILYNASGKHSSGSSISTFSKVHIVPEEVSQARLEEKEVLLAMFGQDDAAEFEDMEDEAFFDVSLPVLAYEAPKRYNSPPPLMLEVYVDNGIAPLYPNESPMLALVGGGLPVDRLRELTNRLREEALQRLKEEQGEPQIFNLLAFVGEAANDIVQEEGAELEAENAKLLEAAAIERERLNKDDFKQATFSGPQFMSDAEKRAYAKDVVAKIGGFTGPKLGDSTVPKGREYHKSGVSDQRLINDLFG